VGLCDWLKKSKFKGLAKQKTNKYLQGCGGGMDGPL
jgi:hypothetical protein